MKPILVVFFAFIGLYATSQTPQPRPKDSGQRVERKVGVSKTGSPIGTQNQSPPSEPAPNPDAGASLKVNPPPNDTDLNKVGLMTSYEFGLSLGVLIFGLIIILLEIYLIRTTAFSEDVLVKFIVVSLIITGTLFLITAGYNNNQIAPAMGLFGTVAGYLLGKTVNNKKNDEP